MENCDQTIQQMASEFVENLSQKCLIQEQQESQQNNKNNILGERQQNNQLQIENKENNNIDDSEQAKKDNANILMDFSNLFKKKPRKKKKTIAKENKENNENQNQLQQQINSENNSLETQQEKQSNNTTSNENISKENLEDPTEKPEKQVIIVEPTIIDNEVPRNLTITQEEMKQRRFLDQRRWFCLSRAQYKRSCGISSLVSVWNYLFSTLGTGDLPPISQEEALIQLGVCKERDRYFGDIEFGAFTGNQTLIKWFKLLCKIYKVQGRAYIMWKNSGEGKTPGVDADLALDKLKEGLRSENNGYIYHAHDHYFCPMGYELTTMRPMDAYKKMEDINESEIEPWIFIGEISKCYPCFHIKKWKDIVKDLTMGNPYYYNIRRPDKGVMERKGAVFQSGGKKFGTTINCLIQFQKVVKIEKKTGIKKQNELILETPIDNINLNNNEIEQEYLVEQQQQIQQKEENKEQNLQQQEQVLQEIQDVNNDKENDQEQNIQDNQENNIICKDSNEPKDEDNLINNAKN